MPSTLDNLHLNTIAQIRLHYTLHNNGVVLSLKIQDRNSLSCREVLIDGRVHACMRLSIVRGFAPPVQPQTWIALGSEEGHLQPAERLLGRAGWELARRGSCHDDAADKVWTVSSQHARWLASPGVADNDGRTGIDVVENHGHVGGEVVQCQLVHGSMTPADTARLGTDDTVAGLNKDWGDNIVVVYTTGQRGKDDDDRTSALVECFNTALEDL
ncbi:hypothetical protein HG530_011667 [Fusarium avenaceum]|nr:hypothetical protein HG530_011667 [Fusarium avenaceum]